MQLKIRGWASIFAFPSIFACFCTLPQFYGSAEEFNPALESERLYNIRQVTFPEMGFVKCGEGYFSPDGTKIVFQAVPKGNELYQIYMMDLAEKVPIRVSTGLGACTCAYFRPDGQKIIFASSHSDPALGGTDFNSVVPGYQRTSHSYVWDFTPYMNIYEANLDGSDLKPLTEGAAYSAECAYSPDGSRIVFASNRSGDMHIYTMQSDGSDIRQVTSGASCYNGGPFFSPDARVIVFRADRETPHYLQVYRIAADGTDEQQLTHNDAVNWAPFWHPSGEAIAFTTSLHGHMHYEIYLLSLKNGALARVTHHAGFDGLPVFNASGSEMMWTSKRSLDGSCQLFIAEFNLPSEF